VRIAVCVVTFRRPVGLARLLGALASLRLPEAPTELRVFVVDNDAAESAREVVEALSCGLPFPVTYHVEKRRGISQARNAALAAASGWSGRSGLVVFLDDDEVPEPGWLAELVSTQQIHAADAVTGPCLSRFEEPPSAWIEAGGFFERPRWPTGTPRHVAFTGNVLVRTEALLDMDEWFDERLAQCGGEDSEFFQRFARAGRRIVWCDTAVVHDAVPASCARLGWILARAFRSGITEAYVARKRSSGMATRLGLLAHGSYCIALGLVQLAAAALRGRAAAAGALRLASFGAGRLAGLMGLQYREYQRIHGC
jgi:GT2 family glycosyltransferase